MAAAVEKHYLLGEFRLEPETRRLSRGHARVHLPNRPFQVFLYLIEHRERLVTRRELLDRFWEGHSVYDETLTKCVGAIRKALDDQSERPRFIETRWGEGYRYVGPVEERLTRHDPPVVEVERLRGVKIVIHEEEDTQTEHHSEAPRDVQTTVEPSGSPKAMLGRRALAAAVTLLAGLALVVTALMWQRSGPSPAETPSPPVRSLAVLPLQNLTKDPADEYLSDGMTEGLITTLSKISGLKVISAGSVSRFKWKPSDPRDVGRQLGVAALLEGSIQRRGESVRVEVRLVSAQDGRVLWAGRTYDRAFQDIWLVQDEIARGVAGGLRLTLAAADSERHTTRQTANAAAYDAYLRGRYFWNKRTEEGLQKAIEYFAQTIERDPAYALAYAGLADSYVLLEFVRSATDPPREAMLKAKAAALQALELDETLAEAHTSLAAHRQGDWDWRGAESEYRRAIELDPNYVTARHWYALYLAAMGRFEEAVVEIQTARELDPLSLIINTDTAEIFYYMRSYDRAIEQATKTLELDPNFVLARYCLARSYEQKGSYPEAFTELEHALAISGDSPATLVALGRAYAVSGNRGRARQILTELQGLSKRQYASSYDSAAIYAGLGESDAAFEWLERAYRESSGLLAFLDVEPMFDTLRSDARFPALVRRIGLPSANPSAAREPTRRSSSR